MAIFFGFILAGLLVMIGLITAGNYVGNSIALAADALIQHLDEETIVNVETEH